MTLTESIVEEAALEWFLLRQGYAVQVGDQPPPRLRLTRLGYAFGHGPGMAPGEAAAERDAFGEVVLVGRLRAALRRLNFFIPEEVRSAIKYCLITRLVRRQSP